MSSPLKARSVVELFEVKVNTALSDAGKRTGPDGEQVVIHQLSKRGSFLNGIYRVWLTGGQHSKQQRVWMLG